MNDATADDSPLGTATERGDAPSEDEEIASRVASADELIASARNVAENNYSIDSNLVVEEVAYEKQWGAYEGANSAEIEALMEASGHSIDDSMDNGHVSNSTIHDENEEHNDDPGNNNTVSSTDSNTEPANRDEEVGPGDKSGTNSLGRVSPVAAGSGQLWTAFEAWANGVVQTACAKWRGPHHWHQLGQQQQQQLTLALMVAVLAVATLLLSTCWCCCWTWLTGWWHDPAEAGEREERETVERFERLITRVNLLDSMLTGSEHQFQQQLHQLVALFTLTKLRVASARQFMATLKLAMDQELSRASNNTSQTEAGNQITKSDSATGTGDERQVGLDEPGLRFLFSGSQQQSLVDSEAEANAATKAEIASGHEDTAAPGQVLAEARRQQRQQLVVLLEDFERQTKDIFAAIGSSYKTKIKVRQCELADTGDTLSEEDEPDQAPAHGEGPEGIETERMARKFKLDPIDFHQTIHWLHAYQMASEAGTSVPQQQEGGASPAADSAS